MPDDDLWSKALAQARTAFGLTTVDAGPDNERWDNALTQAQAAFALAMIDAGIEEPAEGREQHLVTIALLAGVLGALGPERH